MHSASNVMNHRVHQCSSQPASASVERGSNHFGRDNWVLVVTRSASEQDLEENHYLEEVGETIWSTVVEISNCPYCGKRLQQIEGGEAEIAHLDYSSWSSKRS